MSKRPKMSKFLDLDILGWASGPKMSKRPKMSKSVFWDILGRFQGPKMSKDFSQQFGHFGAGVKVPKCPNRPKMTKYKIKPN